MPHCNQPPLLFLPSQFPNFYTGPNTAPLTTAPSLGLSSATTSTPNFRDVEDSVTGSLFVSGSLPLGSPHHGPSITITHSGSSIAINYPIGENSEEDSENETPNDDISTIVTNGENHYLADNFLDTSFDNTSEPSTDNEDEEAPSVAQEIMPTAEDVFPLSVLDSLPSVSSFDLAYTTFDSLGDDDLSNEGTLINVNPEDVTVVDNNPSEQIGAVNLLGAFDQAATEVQNSLIEHPLL